MPPRPVPRALTPMVDELSLRRLANRNSNDQRSRILRPDPRPNRGGTERDRAPSRTALQGQQLPQDLESIEVLSSAPGHSWLRSTSQATLFRLAIGQCPIEPRISPRRRV